MTQIREQLEQVVASYFWNNGHNSGLNKKAVDRLEKLFESYAATREAEGRVKGVRAFAKKVSPIQDEVGWHITPKQVQLIEETAKGKDSNG